MGTLIGHGWPLLVVIGAFVGILSGSLGVGSGIVLIPALIYLVGLQQKTAQGMSLLIMVPMTLMAASRYYMNRSVHVNIWVAAIVAISAVVGAYFGSGIAFTLPSELLRKIFAGFIVLAGILMLVK